jgi:hypothetical protein
VAAVSLTAVGVYYSLYADRSKRFDYDVLVPLVSTSNHARLLFYGLACVACIAYFIADVKVNISFLATRSYLLAALVVVVLALSLRPVRFGLSIAALFIAMTVFERAREKYIYEGRGFFGRLRVKETPGGDDAWARMPQMYENQPTPYEWKVYRRLMHGGINHGQQIVRYKDDRAVQPVLGATTVGLMGSPLGEGPLLASLAAFPDRTEIVFESHELLMRKRREPVTYFYERNGVAELFYKLCWPKAQPVAEIANMNGAADARLPASMAGLAGGDFAAWTMLANTQSEPPFAVLGLGTGILACYAKPY